MSPLKDTPIQGPSLRVTAAGIEFDATAAHPRFLKSSYTWEHIDGLRASVSDDLCRWCEGSVYKDNLAGLMAADCVVEHCANMLCGSCGEAHDHVCPKHSKATP